MNDADYARQPSGAMKARTFEPVPLRFDRHAVHSLHGDQRRPCIGSCTRSTSSDSWPSLYVPMPVDWAEYADSFSAKMLAKTHPGKFENMADAQKKLVEYHSKHKLSKNLKRCKNVNYVITISESEDATNVGKKVVERSGPDKWLGTE